MKFTVTNQAVFDVVTRDSAADDLFIKLFFIITYRLEIALLAI